MDLNYFKKCRNICKMSKVWIRPTGKASVNKVTRKRRNVKTEPKLDLNSF